MLNQLLLDIDYIKDRLMQFGAYFISAKIFFFLQKQDLYIT